MAHARAGGGADRWDELGEEKDVHPFSIGEANALVQRAQDLRGCGADQELAEV